MGLFQENEHKERRDGCNEGLTRWCHTIMLTFVILVALVGSREVMLATELLFAMLTFEGQEIDETAVLSGALVSDCEKPGRRFRGCGHECGIGIRVSGEMRLSQAYICLGQDGHASPSSPNPFRTHPAEAEQEEGGCDYVSQREPSSPFERCLNPCLTKTRPFSGSASTVGHHKSLKTMTCLDLSRMTMTRMILVRCPCRPMPHPTKVLARNEKVEYPTAYFLGAIYNNGLVLPHEKLYLERLPAADRYFKSFMHRDAINFNIITKQVPRAIEKFPAYTMTIELTIW